MAPSLLDHVTAEIRAELGRQRRRQGVLAAPLGISEQQVSKRLSGEVAFNVPELEIVADVLGVPVLRFFPTPERVG